MTRRALFFLIFFNTVLTSASAGTVVHQNEVVFYLTQYPPGASAAFFVTQHSVTAGLPYLAKDNALLPHWFSYHYPYYDCDDDYCTYREGYGRTSFRVDAGRQKSRQVFSDIQRWGYDTSLLPDEMNFAVEGILQITPLSGITYTCRNIVLSQTSQGLRNLWYVLSKEGNGIYYGNRYTDISCSTSFGLAQTFRIINIGSYRFDIINDGPVAPLPARAIPLGTEGAARMKQGEGHTPLD